MPLTPDQDTARRAETKQPTALAVVITFTVLAFISVSLRYFTRFITIKNPGWDDYIVGVAMCASIAMATCMIMEVHNGLGLHYDYIIDMAQTQLRFLFASIICYNISLALVKMSILLQYRRLFTSPRVRLAIHIIMGFVVAYSVVAMLTALFNCVPINAFWDMDLASSGKAHCLPKSALWYTNGIINICTDLAVAGLPLPVIKSLQMATRQKIALMVVFGLGWFVCIVSILRFNSLIVLTRHMDDFSWYGPETAYWSCIETNVAIICACTPVLKPLITKLFPRFASSDRYGVPSLTAAQRRTGTVGRVSERKTAYAMGSRLGSGSTRTGQDPFDDERGLTQLTGRDKTEWEMECNPVLSSASRTLDTKSVESTRPSSNANAIKVTTAITQEISDEDSDDGKRGHGAVTYGRHSGGHT